MQEEKGNVDTVPAGGARSNGKRARAALLPARGRQDAEADAGPMGGRQGQGRGLGGAGLGCPETVGEVVWPSRGREGQASEYGHRPVRSLKPATAPPPMVLTPL